jgi:signal transduction histidine kinase
VGGFSTEDERESYRAPSTLLLAGLCLGALAATALVLSGIEAVASHARAEARHRVERTLDEARAHVVLVVNREGDLRGARTALEDEHVTERLRTDGIVSATIVDTHGRTVGRPVVFATGLERSTLEEVSLPLEGSEGPVGALRIELVSPERALDDAQKDALGRCAGAAALAIALALGGILTGAALLRRERERARTARSRSRLARLGILVGGIASELEPPLQGARESLALLRERLPDELPHLGDEPSATELCDAVADHVSRAEGIVRDFVAYARPEPAAPRIIDVAALVRDWVPALEPELAAHGLKLHVEGLASPAPAVVDPFGLKQVLWSLVRNARDAAPRGSSVRIAVLRERDRVRLRVADNGAGIMPPRREEVFEPLVSTKPWGIGLGLAVSRRLAEAMGAKLALVGGPPGAVFEVSLRPSPVTIPIDLAISPPPLAGRPEAA